MKRLFLILCTLLCIGSAFAGGSKEEAAAPEATVIDWWDHFLPLAELHRTLWDEAEAETGVPVVYTQYDPAKQNEALLLAFRTESLPDVFSMTFGGQELTMYDEGWFQPLDVEISELPQYIQDSLFEGYTVFDGKVYSFPTMSPNHNAPLWYNTTMISEDEVPETFEEARALAKKITEESNGEVYGFVVPLSFTQRINDTFENLMNASGSPGSIDWTTGEYQYASDTMFEIFGFFVDLWDDGSMLPASINLDMRAARERWAAGEAAMLMDGSWNIGVVKTSFPEIYNETVDVAPVLTVDADADYKVYSNPRGGTFFISRDCDCVPEATDTLLKLMGDEYYVGLAENMDQPPLNTDVIAEADVHPSYRKVCDMFAEEMAYRPDPVLRNPEVAKVTAEMRDIHPNPAEILQGYCSGAITDWKAELVRYNEAITAERARAIEKVQSEGGNVSIDDWIFPDFVYGESYSADKYI